MFEMFEKKVYIPIPKMVGAKPIFVVGKNIGLRVCPERPEGLFLEVNRGCEDNVKLIGFSLKK